MCKYIENLIMKNTVPAPCHSTLRKSLSTVKYFICYVLSNFTKHAFTAIYWLLSFKHQLYNLYMIKKEVFLSCVQALVQKRRKDWRKEGRIGKWEGGGSRKEEEEGKRGVKRGKVRYLGLTGQPILAHLVCSRGSDKPCLKKCKMVGAVSERTA